MSLKSQNSSIFYLVCILGLNWTAFLDLTVYYSVAVHLGRTTTTMRITDENVEEFSSVGSTDWMRKCNNKRNKFNEMEQNCNYLLHSIR